VIHDGAGGEWSADATKEAAMGATEDAARIRDGYAAFNRNDVEALVDLFAEDIVWHFPGTSKVAGEHVGRDAALTMLGAYGAASGGTLQANLIDVMASDDHHVAGWANDTASTEDRSLDVGAIVLFTLRDGKVIEARHHFDDQAAVDAFLA
jgi:ketosteroid isomerase-like protein